MKILHLGRFFTFSMWKFSKSWIYCCFLLVTLHATCGLCITRTMPDLTGVNNSHTGITYERSELTAVRDYVNGSRYNLPAGVYHQLKDNAICTVLPTKRGLRAGSRVHKSIPVIITTRPCTNDQPPPTKRTLTNIPCVAKPIQSRCMEMALINARSVNKNGHKVKDFIVDKECDITAITETWLTDEQTKTTQVIQDLCPKGYVMQHKPRTTGQRGGGVGLLHKKGLPLRSLEVQSFHSFEYAELLLKQDIWIRIIVIYRPPPSRENNLTTRQFLAEFSTFLERQILLPGELILLGDFNFHIDDTDDYYANEFLSILNTFALTQHVHEATHINGHILDLVITRSSCSLVRDIHVSPPWVSDHSIIYFTVSIEKPSFQTMTVYRRKWKQINMDNFRQDILDSNIMAPDIHVSELVSQYNKVMSGLLDRHAPIKAKTITLRPQAEWYTTELENEKRTKRRLERKYRKTLLSEDAHAFQIQCARYSELLVTTRQQFYATKVEQHAGDQKSLYKIINKLLHRSNEQLLPAYDSLAELTDRFANFFSDKIQKIRLDLLSGRSSIQSIETRTTPSAFLSEFRSVSEADVEKIIKKSSTKSCSLDPLPTWLLKDCLPCLLPVLTKIINLSLSESVMPVDFKEAILTPLLKKVLLNPEMLKNFRPVSNLAYISKLIEMVVDVQTTEHMDVNCIHETFQSAYKPLHSTETAMLRVKNDVLHALDDGNAVLLVCLDLSAAFDTVDHAILLDRLEKRVGITGKCLKWFRSYLSDRFQKVVINRVSSSLKELTCGGPS